MLADQFFRPQTQQPGRMRVGKAEGPVGLQPPHQARKRVQHGAQFRLVVSRGAVRLVGLCEQRLQFGFAARHQVAHTQGLAWGRQAGTRPGGGQMQQLPCRAVDHGHKNQLHQAQVQHQRDQSLSQLHRYAHQPGQSGEGGRQRQRQRCGGARPKAQEQHVLQAQDPGCACSQAVGVDLVTRHLPPQRRRTGQHHRTQQQHAQPLCGHHADPAPPDGPT